MGKKSFEIICGTYEEYLLGYIYNYKVAELNQSFAAQDHSGSVRCLASCDRYLATGGTDYRVVIYDLKTRKQHYMLIHHESNVNCVAFTPNHSHIMTGSADGQLAIVRVGNWQLEKIWDKPHKGSAVLDIAIHSSGKLALTLGADGTLATWNLVKGRQAFVVNLNSKCKEAKQLEKIIWCKDDVRFLIYGGKYTEIWSIDTGGPLKQVEHEEKVVSCIWVDEDNLLLGLENGNLCKYEINTGEKIVKKAHDLRVKVVSTYKRWFVSGSSSGQIKIWNHNLEELHSYETGCRITCMCIVPHMHITNVKQEDESENVELVSTTPNKTTSAVVVIEEDEDTHTDQKVKKKKHKHIDTSKHNLQAGKQAVRDTEENSQKPKKKKFKTN